MQYCLWFKEPARLAKLKKHCSKSHFEEAKSSEAVTKYVVKEESRVEGPWEFGEAPVKRNSKEDWDEVRQNAIKGRLDKIPSEIFVKHYGNLK